MLCISWFQRQCAWRMYFLGHPSPSNFYVSCWQSNKSSLPLLVLRTFLFLYTLSVLLSSMIKSLTSELGFGYWFIYLSNWCYLLIVLTTGFATAVSASVYYGKPIGMRFKNSLLFECLCCFTFKITLTVIYIVHIIILIFAVFVRSDNNKIIYCSHRAMYLQVHLLGTM